MMKEEMTMKKMISSMKTLVALLMVVATVTSCSSDDTIADQPVQQPVGPQVYTMTVEATKGGDGTRALNLDGNKLNATWTAGDKVEVWTEDGTTTKYGELTATAAGSSTTLTGTLTTLPENGATLTLKYLSPNYSSQDGTLTGTDNSIDKVCDYATATVTATVDGDNVTTTAAAFENQQAVVKFTLKNKANDSDLSATKLVVAVGSTEYEVNPVSAASEIYVAIPGFNGQTITLSATVGSDTYTYEKTGVTFANGNYYRVAVKMTKQASAPEGAISGQFTVGMDGSTPIKVYFSKGNLQATYNGTDWTWAFAENQWDYIGNAEGNTKVSASTPFVSGYSGSSTTVDLFGWVGSSSTWTGAAQYGITSSSSEAIDNTDGYGNNASEALKSDWGNTIGSGWRTLTSDEWTYLFNTRTTGGTVFGTAQARYAHATINTDGTGVNGMILFPDGVDIASTEVTTPGNVNTTSEYATKCTTAQWAALAAKGCVFLPAAGWRTGTNVSNVYIYGQYWSSSPIITINDGYAYSVFFNWENLNPASNGSRRNGCSVRLVRPVQP